MVGAEIKRNKRSGFTLIELMVVIAIIGLIAAIAIPNYISYRNKSYCSEAESNAQAVADALADYFAIWTHDEAPADVAVELGLSLNSVLLAKSRVLRRLRSEAQGLVDE